MFKEEIIEIDLPDNTFVDLHPGLSVDMLLNFSNELKEEVLQELLLVPFVKNGGDTVGLMCELLPECQCGPFVWH